MTYHTHLYASRYHHDRQRTSRLLGILLSILCLGIIAAMLIASHYGFIIQ